MTWPIKQVTKISNSAIVTVTYLIDCVTLCLRLSFSLPSLLFSSSNLDIFLKNRT